MHLNSQCSFFLRSSQACKRGGENPALDWPKKTGRKIGALTVASLVWAGGRRGPWDGKNQLAQMRVLGAYLRAKGEERFCTTVEQKEAAGRTASPKLRILKKRQLTCAHKSNSSESFLIRLVAGINTSSIATSCARDTLRKFLQFLV